MVAIATASEQLKVVRVGIQWGQPQVDKQAPPPGNVPLRPSLREIHVAVAGWLRHGSAESPLDMSMAQLSHIEILASVLEGPSSHTVAPPVVLTVRSYAPHDSSPYQECQTIVDRWEVVSEQPQSPHSAFEQLGPKNGAASAPPVRIWPSPASPAPTTTPPFKREMMARLTNHDLACVKSQSTTRLRKLDPIILPKIVLSVHTTQFGRVICFAFSDGTVQFRDRLTMQEIYNEPNTNSITSPLQVGFQFANEGPCKSFGPFSPPPPPFLLSHPCK